MHQNTSCYVIFEEHLNKLKSLDKKVLLVLNTKYKIKIHPSQNSLKCIFLEISQILQLFTNYFY